MFITFFKPPFFKDKRGGGGRPKGGTFRGGGWGHGGARGGEAGVKKGARSGGQAGAQGRKQRGRAPTLFAHKTEGARSGG